MEKFRDGQGEPDVYVKTVLTFGDKPAPAMAQIAVRKTADEAVETHPEAAKTLLENSYVNDICDSVSTVEKAQRLTTDIDEVLATGGFRVKGWTSNRDLGNDTSVGNEGSSNEMKLLANETAEKVLGLAKRTFSYSKSLTSNLRSKSKHSNNE